MTEARMRRGIDGTVDRPEPARHTPGPWHIGPNVQAYGDKGAYYPIEVTEGEYEGYVARVYQAGKPTVGQGYADALLVAAAPLLLEALKDVVENRSFKLEAVATMGFRVSLLSCEEWGRIERAVQEAVGAENPLCSICRRYHPSDDRHPSE
jgi:hypothetical protein